jgi:hypothetical protein
MDDSRNHEIRPVFLIYVPSPGHKLSPVQGTHTSPDELTPESQPQLLARPMPYPYHAIQKIYAKSFASGPQRRITRCVELRAQESEPWCSSQWHAAETRSATSFAATWTWLLPMGCSWRLPPFPERRLCPRSSRHRFRALRPLRRSAPQQRHPRPFPGPPLNVRRPNPSLRRSLHRSRKLLRSPRRSRKWRTPLPPRQPVPRLHVRGPWSPAFRLVAVTVGCRMLAPRVPWSS